MTWRRGVTMKGSTVWNAKRIGVDRTRSIRPIAAIAVFALAIISAPRSAVADEGGVSFWVPGFFGSLAAAPQRPGWTVTSFYYRTSVSAGADVARAREFETGRIPVNLTANVSASLQARADLGLLMPTYTFATPVVGSQLTLGALGLYGRTSTSLTGTVSGALATPLGTLPFSRFGERIVRARSQSLSPPLTERAVSAFTPQNLTNCGAAFGTVL